MTALILTGGDGLRMRPLTCTKPKAMLPVCGKPVLRYTIDLLKKQGFDNIAVAADRLSNIVTDYLDGGDGTDIIVSRSPEGNCAPVSDAAKINGGDDILVIFGNLLFEADLAPAVAAHKTSSADITAVTAKNDSLPANPSAVVLNDLITDIIPDPARESCASDLAVTGIFIISLSAIPQIENCEDIITEFIPSVIKNGGSVRNFTSDGVFLSINEPDDLFTAARAVFDGLIPSDIKNPCIAASADIANGAEINKDTVIGENVTVCRGAKLNGAIIMDGAFIGERATVNDAIIGSGARLLTGASVFEGAAVGDNAVIAEQAAVQCGVKIWNGRHIDSYASAAQDIKYGFLTPARIGEEGLCGETGSVMTPQVAAAAGSALASLGKKVGIGFKDSPASKSLALAIASGVTAAGGEAWLFGITTAPALAYCTARSRLSAGCWVDAGITAKLRFFSGDGLPLSRNEEKIIEGGINRGEYRRAGFNHFGILRDTSAIVELYKNMLERTAPKNLHGIRPVLNTSGGTVNEMCGGIFSAIGDKEAPPIVFHIGSDGMGASAYTEETGYVFEEKLILICCAKRFADGHDISLPFDFPKAADTLAERYGCRVLRYSGCPSKKEENEARRLALQTPFVRDSTALVLSVLDALESRGMTLPQALAELPEMALATRFVAVNGRPSQLLRKLCTERQASGDGIVLNDKRGRVLIRPVKTEKGVLMKVESFSAETASELCDFYQDKLRKLEKFR